MRTLPTIVVLLSLLFLPYEGAAQRFYPVLYEECQHLTKEASHIPSSRRDTLRLIGDTLLHMLDTRGRGEILFAGVTDGSLTQLAQIWLYTALNYYKVSGIRVYSGGLKPDAINYRIVAALKRHGFTILPVQGYADNPVYFFNLGRMFPDYTIFAKSIDYHANPHDGFLAVPVNPAADQVDFSEYGACCVIPCHWQRPDIWDDTQVEAMKYDEYTFQIGRDMFFLAAYLSDKIKARQKEKRRARRRKKGS